MSPREDVKRLKEQAEFLIESQKKAKAECLAGFDGFKKLIQERIDTLGDDSSSNEHASLQEIAKLVEEHEKTFASDIDQDVEYLIEQLGALGKLEEEKNDTKLKEQLALIMDNEPVQAMDEFKKEINEELSQTRQEFTAVLDDLKAALLEGEIDDLLVYLRELASAEGFVDDEDDEEDIEFDFDPNLFEEHKKGGGCCSPEKNKKQKTQCCGGARQCGDACVCDDNCKCN